MLVIGLTGGIGSGKSTVAKLFAERGVPVIDTDILARDVTLPGKPALKQIADHFGTAILQPDGALNRSELRNIIFNNDANRLWLEQLLHPLIRAEMKHQVATLHAPYCIVVIPLLLETTPNPLIQRTLVVDAIEKLQIERTRERDKVSETDVRAVLNSQVDRLKRLQAADDIISNNNGIEELAPQVEKLHQFYLGLAT